MRWMENYPPPREPRWMARVVTILLFLVAIIAFGSLLIAAFRGQQ